MIRILHEHALSPYAQKVRIMLREKGLPFEQRVPELLGTGDSVDYARISPRMEVPALTDGDNTFFDSTIILEYLEETYPDPPMRPADPVARARLRTIEEVCDTHWEAINWGLGELRFFGRGGKALGPTLRAAAEKELALLYLWLEGELGDAEWLTGDRFGWGDIAALPYVTMSSMFGIDPPAGSKVSAWLERGRARPSVAKTVEEALETIPWMETLEAVVAGEGFRRHFRDHRLEWMIRSGGLQVVIDGLTAGDVRFTDLSRFA
jgi:glutathione S-transferase